MGRIEGPTLHRASTHRTECAWPRTRHRTGNPEGMLRPSRGRNHGRGWPCRRRVQRSYPPVDAADQLSSRPDFAIALYPGHLWLHEDEDRATRDETDLRLRPDIRVTADTPPTFLLMAEDDHVDGVEQALAYYVALQKAGVSTEMHLYAQGGHAFGLRLTKLPIAQWPRLVETWLHTIGVLSR